MASVLTNARIEIAVTALSILSIWVMAIYHPNSGDALSVDAPLSFARDMTAFFVLAGLLTYFLVRTLSESMIRAEKEFDERIRAEQALRERDERFNRFFHVSPVAINVTTLKEGRLLEANDAYWELTGFDPKATIGKTTLELKIWDHELDRSKFVEDILRSGSLRDSSYEFINVKGVKRVTVAFHELIDSGKEPTVLSMFYDITEQVEAQEALKRNNARTGALLEAIPDMIFELDGNGSILQFIPSATLKPALPPEEFLGKNISLVMPPDVVEQTMFAVQRALESGLLQVFEYQLPDHDEKNYYEASVIKNDDDSVIAMVRDVTARKWAATERDKLIDELETKNAELEQFTYTVSHDLKSPLITIKGFLGYVREDVELGNKDRLESDIERIGDATEKMQKLLGDLLELSRVGRLVNDPEYVKMNEIVSDAVELLHGPVTQKNIRMQIDENLPTLYVDRQRISEVLQNLIENATKFFGDQPAPTITVGQADQLRGMPILYVKDNGVGIAPEFKERIFGLFNKLDAHSEGTGIGLALVKRIIEYHGGRIWVESEVGNGATFFFTLPTQPMLER
jgi:PAS domain S-box-containing protein